MKRVVLASASILALTACTGSVETVASGGTGGSSSSSSSSTGIGTGGEGGGGMASDVTGSVIYTYHSESVDSGVAVDLTGVLVQAYVPSGGAWTTIPGQGHSDGSFVVPQVPAGMFMLDVAGTYVWTSARNIDLGSDIGGRPGAQYGAANSQVAGDISNLAPWQTSDTVEFFNANAGGEGYLYGQGATTEPATGATSLSGEACSWYGALIDGSQEDTVYVTQLSAQISVGAQYLTVVRFASIDGVQQTNGGLTTVQGSFTSVPQDQTIDVHFHATAFDKLKAQVNPKATGFGPAYELFTAPGAGSVGELGYLGDLLDLYPGTADANVTGIKYGNPFPGNWGTLVYAGESWSVSYTAKGASSAGSQYGSVYVLGPPDQMQGPILPVVGPVSAPLIDGKDAFGPLQGLSATPTVSWGPPAVGQATGYRVTVYQLDGSSGATALDYKTTIGTTATSVPFPPGLIQPGSEYMFVITAYASTLDADMQPFRISPSYSSADVLTSAASF